MASNLVQNLALQVSSLRRLAPLKRTIHVFCFLVLTLTGLRFLFADNDPYKCHALMKAGQWHGNDWIVPGCTTIQHDKDQLKICLGDQKRKVVIAGDLQLQGLYWGFIKHFESKLEVPTPEQQNLEWEKDNFQLQFIYDPFLDGSILHDTIEIIRDGRLDRPLITIVGAGNHAVANDSVKDYAVKIRSLASWAHARTKFSQLGTSISHEDGPGDLLLFAPAQGPYVDSTNIDSKIVPYQKLNADMDHLVGSGLIDVPTVFTTMTTGYKEMYVNDELGLKDWVHLRRAEALLNLRCNSIVASTGQFPNKATCCARWKSPNWIQISFLLSAIILLIAVFVDSQTPWLDERNRPVVHALAAFTGVIALQYLADRTHLFEQAQRLPFDMNTHQLLIFIAFVIGLATVRRSRLNAKPAGTRQVPSANQSFLPRDQTDEWKGWMQLLIIIYHYNSANTYPKYWILIRLCVSSYLWLTGFGHTLYFLQKKDYSLKRFTNVMIRTNLLPCTLAYVMRTRWLLYYYMPLSSFWFAVVYATLAIGSKYNDNRVLLFLKIALSTLLVKLFISFQELPRTIVGFIHLVFNISFDADGFFHHRVGQDVYIVYVGMAMAPLYLFLKDSLNPDERQDSLSQVIRRIFPLGQYITVGICAVALFSWWYWIYHGVLTGGPFAFPPWQPYVTFIPILSFTVLRNAHPMLRNFHSAAFAWLGRYSGEMYVMQDHLWLSADQESPLRTGLFHGNETFLGDRWRDMVLLTPLYLLCCSIVGDAAGVIANWFTSDSPIRDEKSRLPYSEAEKSLLAGEDKETGDEVGSPHHPLPRKPWWVQLRPRQLHLKYRVGILLATMWFLNETYP